jgi:formylglycine-generating enzyme required for sulfatase activity
MSTDDTERQRRIADLEATLRLPVPDTIRRQMEDELRTLISFGSGNQFADVTMGDVVGGNVIKDTQGSVELSADARLNGVAVGVNLGRIVYGRDPEEEERRRLAWYLASLANTLSRLPLRGLEERLDHGEGLALPQVYVMLATESELRVAQGEAIRPYFQGSDPTQPLDPAYDPTLALPHQAIIRVTAEGGTLTPIGRRSEPIPVLFRAQLCTEAVQQYPRLLLLGAPGGGKSTFIRHLAWSLARRGLDQRDSATALFGWDDAHRLLPIILPLRTLAGRIAVEGAHETTVFAALRNEMQSCCMHQVDDMLRAALDRGTALLLCDGLDEVPITSSTGQSAARITTLVTLRAFATMHPSARIVVTCRSRAFADDLRTQIGWPVETLAPFTLGQVRHFVPAWYGELVAKKQITPEQAERLGTSLVESIIASTKLTAMAETPLLLTLMALVLFNKGELPRDRPQLYERILDLLLGQWDQVREGSSLAEAIGLPDWGSERFRPLLDQLSYQAHVAGSSEDGRGRLGRGVLYTALIDFFTVAQVPEPWAAAARWLDYVEQRSGLLAPDGQDSYVFAHLTLQEHCAGRHIALNSENPVDLVMELRTDDRWREPIFLGAGLMHPAVLNSLLTDLIEREGKNPIRWYRDVILAAEIGQDRDWNYLRTRPMVKVERLQRDLKKGLVAVLADTTQPLPTAERVRAGFLLGELDDPRYPVTPEQWRAELARVGQPGSYFCEVKAGNYIIGSGDDDPDADDNEKPQHTIILDQPLLIARYPVTNDQWRAWFDRGGEKSYFDNEDDFNHRNQPVVGITWDMANAFCVWLSEQLGLTVRLPTEQEWEAAARGGDSRRYPWSGDWHDDHAASEEDCETRGGRWSVPVGCYPSGKAPCGVLDMAGNVWEWTASIWQSYPGAEKVFTDDGRRVLRGGCFNDDRTNVRCGARFRYHPVLDVFDLNGGGVRVCVSPQLAH